MRISLLRSYRRSHKIGYRKFRAIAACDGQKISVESGSIESPGARTGIAPPRPFSCSWDIETPQNTDGEIQEFTLHFDSLNLKNQDQIIVSRLERTSTFKTVFEKL